MTRVTKGQRRQQCHRQRQQPAPPPPAPSARRHLEPASSLTRRTRCLPGRRREVELLPLRLQWRLRHARGPRLLPVRPLLSLLRLRRPGLRPRRRSARAGGQRVVKRGARLVALWSSCCLLVLLPRPLRMLLCMRLTPPRGSPSSGRPRRRWRLTPSRLTVASGSSSRSWPLLLLQRV